MMGGLPRRTVGVASVLAAAGLGWALAVFTMSPRVAPGWLLAGVLLAVGASVASLTGTLAERVAAARERADDHRRLEAGAAEAARRADDLRREVERLRETERVKDEFLATVAHELRTPLTAMLGWAHVLRDDQDPATCARAVEAILRNARAQKRLISDLLDISRIVAGTLQVELQRVEPVAVIRAALETVRPLAEARRITLTSNVDAEAGPVNADASRLQQVLWNILANAIKFTPEGGSVAVRVQVVDGQVETTVEDTGPGIPPDFLPHVFERFRQAGGEATRGKGGLGLGLAIARAVVERHQGTIAAANREPGPGAVFTVRLPVRTLRPAEARPSPEPLATPEAGANGRLPSLEGLLVAVMDADEPREMVATIMQNRGARVVGLPSTPEAFSVLAEQRPDVLLLDLDLADAAEDSLIRRIRALPAEEGGETPAAALASFGEGDRTRALLSGFQLQLAKPVQPAELVAAVASLAGRTRPRLPLPEARA